MSVRLTMSALVDSSEPVQGPSNRQGGQQPNGELELGWDGVASGLTRILIGYSLIVLQAIGAILLIWLLISALPARGGYSQQTKPETVFALAAGFGLLALTSLFSCILVFTGKCRCVVSAPESGGARWLIFGCLLCMLAGTILGTANSFFGNSTAQHLNAASSKEELLTKLEPPSIQEITSIALNLIATVLFVLFLRAIGQRFESTTLMSMVDMYLIILLAVIGVTVQIFYLSGDPFGSPFMLLVLGVGWLFLVVLYIALIVVARAVLGAELALRRSGFARH